MNTKDEIITIMEGHDPKGLPPPVLFTQTGTVGQMRHCGISWPEANFDVDKMVELALQPSRMFGFATARIPYDVVTEAEALGCIITEGSAEAQPSVIDSPWRNGMEVPPAEGLPSMDEFLAHRAVSTLLGSADALNSSGLFTTALCDCPAMVTSHLIGMENMLLGIMIDPEPVRRWNEAVTPYLCSLARILSEKVDNVMVITDLTADLMPPEFIPELVEQDKKVISSIKGSFKTIHNCGNTTGTLEEIASLKADVVSLETSSDPDAYIRGTAGRMRLMGGVNTVSTLLCKRPNDVLAECIRAAKDGFVLIAPECGVPPLTPDENLRALADYRSNC